VQERRSLSHVADDAGRLACHAVLLRKRSPAFWRRHGDPSKLLTQRPRTLPNTSVLWLYEVS